MSRVTAIGAEAVFGLVLAGGRSRRMGTDKAQLRIHAEPQAVRAARLLDAVCDQTFVSVRLGQPQPPWAEGYDCIEDQLENVGPLGGILAAQNAQPDAAWLVLACDLPFVDPLTLKHLLTSRDPGRIATAYRSATERLPEPLCAIYEPASRKVLEDHLAQGIRCPRKILINSDVKLLDLPNPDALVNLNTPEDLAMARERMQSAQELPA